MEQKQPDSQDYTVNVNDKFHPKFKISKDFMPGLSQHHQIVGNLAYLKIRIDIMNKQEKKQVMQQLIDQSIKNEIENKLTYKFHDRFTNKDEILEAYKTDNIMKTKQDENGQVIMEQNTYYTIIPAATFLYNFKDISVFQGSQMRQFKQQYKLSDKFELNQLQKDIVKEVWPCFGDKKDGKYVLKRRGSVILSLKTGCGKTVLALYIMSKLRLKTLIVVHQASLHDQWIVRFSQMFGINVQISKGSSISKITDDVYIGIINSVSNSNNKFNIEHADDFDFIIVDECHKLGAQQFNEVLNIYGKSKFVLALSATPERNDKKHVIYYPFFDKIVDVVLNEKINIHFKLVGFKSKTEMVRSRGNQQQSAKEIQEIVENIVSDNDRFLVIMDWIKWCYEQKKFVMVISIRIKLLERIFDELALQQIPCDRLYDKFKDIKTNNILLGSLSKCKEGLDLPYLNTALFCTPPQGDLPGLTQLVGRITRKSGGSDETTKLIIDICDQIYCGKSSKRMVNYGKIFNIQMDRYQQIEYYDQTNQCDRDTFNKQYLNNN